MEIDTLKSMTHEDLVRRVQELEDENNELKERNCNLLNSFGLLNDKFNRFRDAVKSVALLVD